MDVDFSLDAAERREHRVLHKHCQQQRLSRKSRLAKAACVFGVVLLQLAVASVCVSAEPSDVQARRVFVPALYPERWPAGDWVPVSPQVLDTLMKSPRTRQTVTIVLRLPQVFTRQPSIRRRLDSSRGQRRWFVLAANQK